MKLQILGSDQPASYLSTATLTRPANQLDYSAGDAVGSCTAVSHTVTITEANPGVCTWNSHPFVNGDVVTLSTTGALPTNLVAATNYYVVSKAANTFQLAATEGGTAIDTSGSAQSGVHTVAGSTAASAILEFTEVGPPGALVEILATDLEIDSAAIPSGMTTHSLRLYNASPTAILDNAAWSLLSADRSSFQGTQALGTVVDEGATLFVQNSPSTRRFAKLAAGSTSLYGVVTTAGAHEPDVSVVYKVRLHTQPV